MRNILALLLITFLFSCTDKFESVVTLPSVLSDGMVLQRDKPVTIWGKGIPGEKVRVSIAGSISSGKVLPDSTWKVSIPANVAGGPHIMQVNQQQVKDVYFGDVWLAGGQSNMEWPLKSGVIGGKEEYESGGIPLIRFFKVEKSYAAIQRSTIPPAEWRKADSSNLMDFSAIAWFFAKKNHLEMGVPVGIIESNWGGTPAEGWTKAEILAEMQNMSYSEEALDMQENQEKWEREFQANENRREMRDMMVHHPDSISAKDVSSVSYNDLSWKRINLPADNPLSDIAWLRKSFNLTKVSDLELILPAIDQMAFIYVNGKLVHHKDWGSVMPDVKVPDDLLFTGKNVITIRVINTWNNQPRIGEKGMMYLLQDGRKINLEGTWAYSNDLVEPKLPEVKWYNWKPGAMYNAMIHPLVNYTLRGIIWYQGESNAGRAGEYQALFSTLISSWRTAWNSKELPFLFVQLANFMERKEMQPESNWAALREAQRKTLELPKTGMAVTIDIGEEDDIHPRNKKDVGERLWLQAKRIVFNEQVVASGPEIKSIAKDGAHLTLTYESTGEGLTLVKDGDVLGFIIKDQNGKWHQVKGQIEGKNQVKIPLESGIEPMELRYAWADNPEVNLINSEGLPAIPFQKIMAKKEE
ncbi:sialate O-acetylesterase [Algoriphagus algorifonticola]|uniref:sialate O-acetylesterase n=1 Tax=Algoriphagus algorifonticola TaxID=2593007 RepID=UPI00119F5669|nr:sialate O-acetylesterase [Algoriphagus algorifonticola]